MDMRIIIDGANGLAVSFTIASTYTVRNAADDITSVIVLADRVPITVALADLGKSNKLNGDDTVS